MCLVNEGNLRYIAVVKDENCSDLETESSLNFTVLKLSLRHFRTCTMDSAFGID
jgi:hypothetical protein